MSTVAETGGIWRKRFRSEDSLTKSPQIGKQEMHPGHQMEIMTDIFSTSSLDTMSMTIQKSSSTDSVNHIVKHMGKQLVDKHSYENDNEDERSPVTWSSLYSSLLMNKEDEEYVQWLNN